MGTFLARALLQRLLLLLVISVVAHAVIHLAPGEPSAVDPMNPRMKAEDVAKIREAFHLNEPLYLQYVYWMRDLLSGELTSFKDGQPVLPKIWAAVRRGSVFDRATSFSSYALISFPSFFLAYVVIIWVVVTFDVPVIGMQTFGMEDAAPWYRAMDRVWHLAIPSLLAALGGIAVYSRYVRSQMLDVLAQDYVRTARSKGLAEDDVVYRHALRNALLPFVTMFGLMIPGLVGGSVIVEQIFAWPGLGRLVYDAVLARDFPVILTVNFIGAVLTLAGTLISDVLYAVVDPRIRVQ
jgi:peptide/nickel transport system permease protein